LTLYCIYEKLNLRNSFREDVIDYPFITAGLYVFSDRCCYDLDETLLSNEIIEIIRQKVDEIADENFFKDYHYPPNMDKMDIRNDLITIFMMCAIIDLSFKKD
jgi:hypothetical protein